MKKLFFALAIMLSSSFAFANTNLVTVDANNIATNYDINVYERAFSSLELVKEKSCTISGNVTVTHPNGQTSTYSGTFTINGVSCAELLISLMSRE